jgi:exosortase
VAEITATLVRPTPAWVRSSAAALMRPEVLIPVAISAIGFVVLFWHPVLTLGRDWWNDPDAGHGLLLAPLACYLAWRKGLAPDRRSQIALGITVLAAGVLLRYLSGLAAELFTMRVSLYMAAAGLLIMAYGVRQLLHWWLPVTLLMLSIPIPQVLMGSLALPLQFVASEMGAAMLEWRQVPVRLAGNVINIPGQQLFVTEACSGLRSLTSLIALGVLIGGLWLRYPIARVFLLALTIPVAILLNGVRVFLTGFLVYYVDPKLGSGFMHVTEGWVIFVVAFLILGGIAWAMTQAESLWVKRRGQ